MIVYLVIERRLKFIHSVWSAEKKAEETADALCVSKTNPHVLNPEWIVEEHEVQQQDNQ